MVILYTSLKFLGHFFRNECILKYKYFIKLHLKVAQIKEKQYQNRKCLRNSNCPFDDFEEKWNISDFLYDYKF